MVTLYILVCVLWGVYAHRWQAKKFPTSWLSNTTHGMVGHFLFSAILCPVSMLMAIILFNRNNR